MSEEWTDEDVANLDRLEVMYRGLSENDRYYIVSRWDKEQGLEDTFKRQQAKHEAPERASRRKRWIIIAIIPALFILNWIGGLVRAERHRNADSFVLDQLREHSKNNDALKTAIADA